MELWIRNQDKNVLQKTNALFIANTDENIFSIIDNVNMTNYGTYKTKERALEVLDEIQSSLDKKRLEEITTNYYKYNGKIDFTRSLKETTCVYEMPEE